MGILAFHKEHHMDNALVAAALDAEIGRLQQARALLLDTSTLKPLKRKRGPMTPEGRARIAAAQRKRWAAQKRAS